MYCGFLDVFLMLTIDCKYPFRILRRYFGLCLNDMNREARAKSFRTVRAERWRDIMQLCAARYR
jgi:hypothetical protein